MRCVARSRRSASRPLRSEPNASIAPSGRARAPSRSPPGWSARSGRVVGGRRSRRATGRAKCRPAEPRRAAGCHGSWRPVVSTPAAPAAAATRTTAPMLPRSLGRCSSTSGAAPGDERRPKASTSGRRASAMTPVAGGSGASAANRSGSISHTSAAILGARSGASTAVRRASAAASPVTANSMIAPKRSACFSACKPSITTMLGSPRAARKRGVRGS